jgi:hypothetical protein
MKRITWLSGSLGLAALAVALILWATPDPAAARGRDPLPDSSVQAPAPGSEAPLMYLLAGGPPGRPAAKECPACSQLLDALRAAPSGESGRLLPAPLGTVSGWQPLHVEGFESDWPGAGTCWTRHDTSDDGQDRTWGADGYRVHSGEAAAWPARGGLDGVDPQPPVDYPGDLDSWMICGPFDFSDASSAYAAFWLWSQVEEGQDEFFVGVSNGADDWYQGYAWDVSVPEWARYTLYFPGYTGEPADETVWVAWNFASDASNPAAYEGPWVDDVEVAAARACPAIDPGEKALHVHPGELPGQVDTIDEADTGRVRLEFRMEPDGSLDLAKYAAIVDGLCEHGMGAVGLVDYVSLPDDLDGDGQDYDDPEDYLAYQQRFTETVEALAHHFRGSIRHWEIWNEENGLLWHIRPEYYARLLVKVSEVLKGVDPANQVLFGGLDHVWVTGQYLEPVYDALDADWAGARPFDILAVHPYFVYAEGKYVLDPNVYLRDDENPGHTILDPYLAFMASRGDGDKDIWITEIGWNSALDNPAIENCPGMKQWCVDKATQARYLKDSFDILLNEVQDPDGNRDRVETIVWYQYHDTATPVAEIARRMSLPRRDISADPDAICPADWGLVDGNKQPKPAYWAYQSYPLPPTAVTLTSFTATPRQAAVLLAWQTAAEAGLLGFDLYRAASPDGPRIRLNEALIRPPFPGNPGGADYEYVDGAVAAATTYYYFLESLGIDASTTTYGPVSATVPAPPAPLALQATNDGPTPLGRPTTLTATLTGHATLTYTWALGDGDTGTGTVVRHTYPAAGRYTAIVTAANPLAELRATTTVTVTRAILHLYLPLVRRGAP